MVNIIIIIYKNNITKKLHMYEGGKKKSRRKGTLGKDPVIKRKGPEFYVQVKFDSCQI